MKLTFRSTFLGILLTLIGVTVSLVGATSYYSARFTADDLSSQLLDQTSARVDEQIQKLITKAVDQSALNRRLLDAGRLRARDFPDLIGFWLEAMAVHRELSSIFIGVEATGESTGVSRLQGKLSIWQSNENESTGKLDQRDFWPEGYPTTPYAFDPAKPAPDIRTRPWYVAAKAARHSIWTETYAFLGVAGTAAVQGVTYAEPVYGKSGALSGVISADFDLKGLCAFLETLHVGRHGFAFVVERRADGSQRLIAHPEAELLDAARSGAKGEIDDGRVRALMSAASSGGAADASQRRNGASPAALRFRDAGTSYIGGWRALAGDDAPPWMIGIVVPERDVMERVDRSNAISVSIALAGFALAIVFGVYVARQVARPLESLSREMAAIADLHLEARPVAHSIVLEVDRVATATEEMKTGLRSFQKFVPADIVRSILASKTEARLGGERRQVTIYFSDIVDFTTISEKLTPEAVVEHLRAYLGALNSAILDSGGTVDKFIGDAIMAFWGAPADDPEHATRACLAALKNQEILAELCPKWEAEGKPALWTRIGLHSGEVVVGNIGSETRLNYTVIGDAVNLSSRLEALNKYYGTRIMVSEVTYAAAKDAVVARRLDWVSVKGRGASVGIYELLGKRGEVDDATLRAMARYEEGLARYRAEAWDEAIAIFEEVLAARADANDGEGDGPSALMIARCRAYRENPPPAPWDGVHRLETK